MVDRRGENLACRWETKSLDFNNINGNSQFNTKPECKEERISLRPSLIQLSKMKNI